VHSEDILSWIRERKKKIKTGGLTLEEKKKKKKKEGKEGIILAMCSRACERKKKEKKEPAVCSRVYKRKKEGKQGKPRELILEKTKGVWQQV
jgi:hypothetical protein